MYLKHLEVVNIGKFSKQSIEFGPRLTVISGTHREGKTTLLDTIKSFFEGGLNRDLVKIGETHSEAAICWSDGMRAVKTQDLATSSEETDSYKVEVTGPDGSIRKRAAETLSERVAKGSFDPAEFLKADPRKRADFLISHLNLVFDASEVNAALETRVGKLPNSEFVFPSLTGKIPLEKFDEIFDTVYESRRQINVQIRDASGILADLRASLPPVSDGTDWAGERDKLQSEIVVISEQIASKSSEIKLEAEQARSAKRQKVDAKIAALKKELSDFIHDVDQAESAAIAEQTADLESRRARLSIDLGTAKANADRETSASGTKAAIAKREKDSEGLAVKEMRRTAILEALDKMKHARMAELPIGGLSIKFDSKKRPIIAVNSVPLERLSGQEALFLAVQCIQFAAAEHPLILSEGDSLNEEHVKILADACASADPPVQVILARHSEGGELKVVRY